MLMQLAIINAELQSQRRENEAAPVELQNQRGENEAAPVEWQEMSFSEEMNDHIEWIRTPETYIKEKMGSLAEKFFRAIKQKFSPEAGPINN